MKSLSHSEYRSSSRFQALDGLRAVTVLSLVGMHFDFGALQWLIGKGKITVFFVLSGFVITLLLLRDEDKYGKVRLRNFYVRRQFRLLPAYFTVLAVAAVARFNVPDTGQNDGSWPEMAAMLPYYATFTHEWGPGTADVITFVHSWTLSYEQKFYLVWPLIFMALSIWAPRWRLPVTALIAGSCLAVIPVFGARWVQYFALILGCVLGLLLYEERTYRFIRPLTHPVAALFVAAGFLVLHVWVGTQVKFPHDPVLAWYAIGVFVLIISILNTGVVQWILMRRFFLFVGERGYSMYLVHGLAGAAVLSAAPAWGSGSIKTALIIAGVTIVFADGLYRFVELPSAAAGRRFIKWLDERKAARQRAREPIAADTPIPVEPAMAGSTGMASDR
ncbi:acyltransferase family protein [Stackebrandtia nassauensis]|uniref:Acyltransferase 3 n=1 Tax=Stackebrandtia nassauensis (strain DSM 44728 / CIP 108903 / NRRL B-16338 / NBRC 102104 / LLR-40K-21) TaxID=446470 RepID=D3QB36_STANL|nr:acyltransferase [Stackebrandtia nassauensis]ADD40853.1 acyltransferase 3 [Stackebrandtia nassauensis DSM 44728]